MEHKAIVRPPAIAPDTNCTRLVRITGRSCRKERLTTNVDLKKVVGLVKKRAILRMAIATVTANVR